MGDVRLFVEVAGFKWVPDGDTMRQRPTVVVLHGGPGADWTSAQDRFGFLSDVAQVVFYDHRGNGRSDDGNRAKWTLQQWGDDVEALCRALDIERPIVIGASFGGMVAMSYATRHREHPAALGLIVTAASEPAIDEIVEAFRKLGGDAVAQLVRSEVDHSTAETQERFTREAYPLTSRHPDALTFIERQGRRTVSKPEVDIYFSNGEGKTMDFRADLAKVKCPTLVLSGEMDPICPPSSFREIVEALPEGVGETHLIQGAGHLVMLDAREECERIVRDFVLRHSPT